MHRLTLHLEKVNPAHWRQSLLVALTTLVALPIAIIASILPFPLILPAFGIMLLLASAVICLIAWWRAIDRHSEHITLWDVAGIFALVGFAAVLLSRPEEVLPLLGHPITPP